MALAVALGIVFAFYVVLTCVLWWKGPVGSMRKNLHDFAGVVAAFIGLFLSACAIAESQERLDDLLQRASIEAFYDEHWNIYLQLVGDPGYTLPKRIKITPTFYKRGKQPFPTYTGSTVEFYEGDYEELEPDRSIVIRNADAILCRQQAEEVCEGMTLILVSAQLDDWPPVSVDRRLPADAN